MANVYEDFDKRSEHDRRFTDIVPKKHAPAYDAPDKAHYRPREQQGESTLHHNLGEELLAVGSVRKR